MVAPALVAAGCGESEAQAKQNLADDISALKVDLAAFINPETYSSMNTFTDTWNKTKTSFNKMLTDAKKVKDIELKDVETSYNDLKNAVGNVTSEQSLQQKASAILLAGQAFLMSLESLNQEVTPSK